ncbi:MAG: Ribbon-helix-helix domain [Alphaproteobacteria bacterium]|jgi:predicted transcriptional regulator|nr:Ribbon-helix-helix domain [Alphaproteobacteria bacterium]
MDERQPEQRLAKKPKFRSRVTANLAPDIERELDEVARKTGLTVPALIRRAVDELLARYRKKRHL